MRIRSGLFCGSIYWVLLVSGRVSVPKPLSQIQRGTRRLLQGLSPRTSFGGFGLKESQCPDSSSRSLFGIFRTRCSSTLQDEEVGFVSHLTILPRKDGFSGGAPQTPAKGTSPLEIRIEAIAAERRGISPGGRVQRGRSPLWWGLGVPPTLVRSASRQGSRRTSGLRTDAQPCAPTERDLELPEGKASRPAGESREGAALFGGGLGVPP